MGAYLSARESADYCGVSEKTIRNWIASGRLSAEKSAGSFRIAQEELDVLRSGSPHRPQGAESASAEVRAEGGPRGAEGSAEAAGVVELVGLVRDLQAQLVSRTEAATIWQARAELLAERLAAAESRILALSAPRSPVEAPGAPESPDPTPELSPSWWRSWRAWLAAGLVVVVVGLLSVSTAVVVLLATVDR